MKTMPKSQRRLRHHRFLGAIGTFLLSVACGDPGGVVEERTEVLQEAATPSKKFGSWCQGGEYEVNPVTGEPWLTPTGTKLCDNFNAEMKTAATHAFTYDLKGAAKQNWEKDWDSLSMELVDLSFGYLHGGAHEPDTADYGLWKDGVSDWHARVLTSNMRLGEEKTGQRGLSILATYSCDTLLPDANLWNRWGNAFKGGLRMVVGSHGSVHSGSTADNIGKVFAQKLKAGWTIVESWRTALASTSDNNHVAVMATGNSPTDCGSRRDGMKWSNFTSYNRRKDSSITHYCWITWDNQ